MLLSSVSERSLGGLSSDSGGLSIVQQNKNSCLGIFCLFLSLCDTHKHECKYAHLFDSYVYIVTDSLIRMSTQMRRFVCLHRCADVICLHRCVDVVCLHTVNFSLSISALSLISQLLGFPQYSTHDVPCPSGSC